MPTLVLFDRRTGAMAGCEAAFLLDAFLQRDQQRNRADNQNSCNRERDQIAALAAPVVIGRDFCHGVQA